MIKIKSCPICESYKIAEHRQVGADPRVMHEIMPDVLVEAAIITHYYMCQNCNLIFQSPRFSDKELLKFYKDGYYRKTLNSTIEDIDYDERQRAKNDAKIIKKNVGKVSSHLDIGSSRGHLLNEVDANIKVGVEINSKNAKIEGIKIFSKLDQIQNVKFDLITAIHVLEHESKPGEFIKDIGRLLNNDGYLIIEVPTWKSLGGPLRLAHLYHFEPNVLRHLLISNGYKIVYEEFTPHLLLICRVNDSSV